MKKHDLAWERMMFPSELNVAKDKAMRLGLYRTARMLDIATQEVGWELQGASTPKEQQARQDETLRPSTPKENADNPADNIPPPL
jgi:hypothetical protein